MPTVLLQPHRQPGAGTAKSIAASLIVTNMAPAAWSAIRVATRGLVDHAHLIEPRQLPGALDPSARAAIVVGYSVENRWYPCDLIAETRRRHTLVPILVCSEADVPRHAQRNMAQAGCDAVLVVRRAEDWQSFRKLIANELKHSLTYAGWTERTLAPMLSSAKVIGWIVRRAFAPLSVAAIAQHFAVDRKTIYRSVVREGWRSVEGVIALARLLHVAQLLEVTDLPIAGIARRLQFRSSGALHKHVKRVAGVTATDMRMIGPIALAEALWRFGASGYTATRAPSAPDSDPDQRGTVTCDATKGVGR